MISYPERVKSPCVGNCCLNQSDVCVGCFRSLQEIKSWSVADDQLRLQIIMNTRNREYASTKRQLILTACDND